VKMKNPHYRLSTHISGNKNYMDDGFIHVEK